MSETRHRARKGGLHGLIDKIRAEGDAGHHVAAVELAATALRMLDDGPEDPPARALVLINLAANTAQLGHVDQALAHLNRAADLDPLQSGAVASAKGLILYFARRYTESAAALDLAVAGRAAATPRVVCAAYIRRGNTRLALMNLNESAEDFRAAAKLAAHHDFPVLAFMALHNLGFVRYVQGDLPESLAVMRVAQKAAGPDTPDGVPTADRGRVLMAAGLIREARVALSDAVRLLSQHGAGPDLADALLARAELERIDRRYQASAELAAACGAIARELGSENLELVAELQVLSARALLDAGADEIVGAAAHLAERLDVRELTDDAVTARLLQAESLVELGQVRQARDLTRRIGPSAGSSLNLRIHRQLILGRIEMADGRTEKGLTELAAGLDELAAFGARLGSQDMQSAASVHGVQLAQLGLRAAVNSRDPAEILEWLERSRAVSTRLPAVTPPADPELAGLLGTIRLLNSQDRTATLAGRPDPEVREQIRTLRERVRELTWTSAGAGRAVGPIRLGPLQSRLAADRADPTVVAFITGLGGVRALVVSARQARYFPLGGWEDGAPEHVRRSADLDMLAAPRIPAALRAVARRSLQQELDRLDALLLAPVATWLTGGPVVIVAVGDLATVPWSLLRTLRGRPVTVNASVTAAVGGSDYVESGTRPPAHTQGVLAVAGPEVTAAVREVDAVVGCYPNARGLTGAAATGSAVLQAIPDGGVLHIAAHGRHETDSPLFSHVLLADGPLYGYDIAPNPALPAEVILSSCDVGRMSIRPGGEPLGLAAALLRSGVATVIAGVSRISDEVAAAAMANYHRFSVAGRQPAAALAAAIADLGDELAPFGCFGSGLAVSRELRRAMDQDAETQST